MGYFIYFIGLILVIFIFINYFAKAKRVRVYKKYKLLENLSSREYVFYYHLKKALPNNYHVINKVNIKDIIKTVKVKKYFECVEMIDKLKKYKNKDMDFVILDNKFRVISAINIYEEDNTSVPKLFCEDNQVELFLKQLDLNVIEYYFKDSYNLKDLKADILN